MPKPGLEEVADLAGTPTKSGPLPEDSLGLLGQAGRVLQEVWVAREVFVPNQGELGLMQPRKRRRLDRPPSR